ncbi:hypothetical protein FOCC_FOCC016202 [Frankliniella occidentalis]|nr:hypothetical protein FOCC_FOCC016202 [Frankliniella occidentalis]
MQVGFQDENTPLVPIDKIDLPECEENWEDEPLNTFNPKENAKAKALIRSKHCVPRSERKQFRAEHRAHVMSNADIATRNGFNVPRSSRSTFK